MATGTESPLVLLSVSQPPPNSNSLAARGAPLATRDGSRSPTVSLALRCMWRRAQTAMCTAWRGATHAHDLARCRRWHATPLRPARDMSQPQSLATRLQRLIPTGGCALFGDDECANDINGIRDAPANSGPCAIRAAIEGGLDERCGLLNYSHIRTTVQVCPF